ncbi:hypothetical protein P5G51_017015 [Virgibacillus sp. 179-BFC.A HS]|uniref:Uncharacterized protein n=1 Tax=Tigheibacillus jepli TaxID=3035914 RepID=A0ABU5CM15_9BACI|nr:hypothetical protein [Virgibacillus sp. 179-BFC.A HS]MDY0406829.1 hypothetical protein [Virgibacillus sp. 179-BFC.A HS]
MTTGQQKLWHQFEANVDLTYKGDGFVDCFTELEELARKLYQLVEDETENSEGEIIERIDKVIMEQTEFNQIYCHASKTSMKGIAERYTDLVNDMNTQEITLFYNIIDMGEHG